MNNFPRPQPERLIALLYGELPPEEEQEMRAQLASDPELRAEWEGLQAARSLLQRWDLKESAPRSVFVQRIGMTGRTPGSGFGGRLRGILGAPAWGFAAAALALAVLALADFRIDRTASGLSFRFGQKPVETAPDYLTRQEFDLFARSMGETVFGALNEYTQQRDRDVAVFMQAALSGMTSHQVRAYQDLRTRIDGIGIGLMEDQTQTRERVDYLWNERLRSAPAPNGDAPRTQPEGDRDENH